MESSKICNLCWEYIKSQDCFEFYRIPVGRDDMKLDTNNLRSEVAEALYKVNLIERDGVLGSCEDYGTRKKLDKNTQLKPLNYEAALVEFGQRLVIVADQKTRYKTLVPSYLYLPAGTISVTDYAILERVGRARGFGERTAGKNSLLDFIADPRSMFGRRKALKLLGLLDVKLNSFGRIAILPRFSNEDEEPLRPAVLRRMISEASADPKRQILCSRAKDIFDELAQDDTSITWKVFCKHASKKSYFKYIKQRRYDDKGKRAGCDPVLQLKRDPEPLMADMENGPEEKRPPEPFLNTDGQYYRVSYNKQILLVIESAGLQGVNHREISQILGMPIPTVRNGTKGYLRTGEIYEVRTQVRSSVITTFISTKFKGQTEEKLLEIKKSNIELEEPKKLFFADVYGVTTTIKITPTKDLCKSVKLDTDSRKLRTRIMLEVVQQMGIVSNFNTLSKKVSEMVKQSLDHKTAKRHMQLLIDHGDVYAYHVSLQRENITKSTYIYCDSRDYDMNHERFLGLIKVLHKRMVPVINMKMAALTKKELNVKMRHYEPSFLNFSTLRPLHKFLMHVTHFWTTQSEAKPAIDVPSEWQESLSDGENLPPVYSATELDWRTFVSPRKADRPTGWITIREIVDLMPLQMIRDLYKPSLNSPNVSDILKHPVKRYYMNSQCPTASFVDNPWFIETFLMALQKLCFIGLLRFGATNMFRKDKLPIYLNVKRDIWDTAKRVFQVDPVVVKSCPKISYEFTSNAAVKKYWADMTRICLNTVLPRNKAKGYAGVSSALSECLQPISEADGPRLDDGSMPGDGGGAAGTHSIIYIHLYYYWDTHLKADKGKRKKIPATRAVTNKAVAARRTKKVRTYRHTFDEVDEYAKGSSGLRTKWLSSEDTALLFTRLANLYISTSRSHLQVLSCISYRDIVHWMCGSLDKSAKMCSRRVQFLIKNDVTKTTLDICLKEMSIARVVTDRFPPGTMDKLKEMYPADEEFTSAVKIYCVELVHVLFKMFSKLTATSFQKRTKSILPDTAEEFEERYTVVAGQKEAVAPEANLKPTQKIQFHVVYNVIHSSMSCAQDDFEYNLVLLDIYKNYKEQVLSGAMDKARQTQLITKQRINQTQMVKTIPLSTRPFHLSGPYAKRFCTKFNYQMLAKIQKWIAEAAQGKEVFGNVDQYFAFMHIGLNYRGAIEVDNSSPADVRIAQLDRVDEEEEVVVAEGKDDQMQVDAPKVSFRDQVEILDFNYQPLETMLKVTPLNWHIFCYLKNEITNKPETYQKLIIDPEGLCNCSCLMDKWHQYEDLVDMLSKINVRDYKSGINQVLEDLKVEKEKLVEVNKKDLGSLRNLKWKKIKYLTLFDYLSRDSHYPLDKQMTEIRLKDGVTFPITPNMELLTNRLHRFARIAHKPVAAEQLFPGDLKKTIGSLLDFAKGYEMNGAPIADIVEEFGQLDNLEEVLLTLLENHWLLWCGIEQLRLVHRQFKEPWVVVTEAQLKDSQEQQIPNASMQLRKRSSTSQQDWRPEKVLYLEDAVKRERVTNEANTVILRIFPWIRVTGTVNQRVADKVMGTLLLHLQGNAGITVTDLFKGFPYFHETHLILMLIVMKEQGLIDVFKMKPKPATLWSNYESPEIGKKTAGTP